MLFGLKNALAFQRLMNSIHAGGKGIKRLVYLDNIIIYGLSLQEHNCRLSEIFQRLRKNNLKLQIDKCEFCRKMVNNQEHVITKEGIQPDPEKITAERNFPTPKKVKDI